MYTRECIVDYGFGEVAPTVEELATPDKIFMLGRKPWRIDILPARAHTVPAQREETTVSAFLLSPPAAD